MCTLIALWRSVPGYDVVVGMNRDESAVRPSDPPALLETEPVIVAPRDRQAGGTWIGASASGLVVVLTNAGGNVVTDPKVPVIQGLLAKASIGSIDDAVRALQATLRTHASGPGG